jgi:hypothetical protein
VRLLDVGHHQLQALHGARLAVDHALADRDRARGPRRCQLHEADLLGDGVVVVGVEPGLIDVERLRAIDVGDGYGHQLEFEVHAGTLPRGVNGMTVMG